MWPILIYPWYPDPPPPPPPWPWPPPPPPPPWPPPPYPQTFFLTCPGTSFTLPWTGTFWQFSTGTCKILSMAFLHLVGFYHKFTWVQDSFGTCTEVCLGTCWQLCLGTFERSTIDYVVDNEELHWVFFCIRKDKQGLIQPREELFTVYHYHKLWWVGATFAFV